MEIFSPVFGPSCNLPGMDLFTACSLEKLTKGQLCILKVSTLLYQLLACSLNFITLNKKNAQHVEILRIKTESSFTTD